MRRPVSPATARHHSALIDTRARLTAPAAGAEVALAMNGRFRTPNGLTKNAWGQRGPNPGRAATRQPHRPCAFGTIASRDGAHGHLWTHRWTEKAMVTSKPIKLARAAPLGPPGVRRQGGWMPFCRHGSAPYHSSQFALLRSKKDAPLGRGEAVIRRTGHGGDAGLCPGGCSGVGSHSFECLTRGRNLLGGGDAPRGEVSRIGVCKKPRHSRQTPTGFSANCMDRLRNAHS
jgi:hypothetical protein